MQTSSEVIKIQDVEVDKQRHAEDIYTVIYLGKLYKFTNLPGYFGTILRT